MPRRLSTERDRTEVSPWGRNVLQRWHVADATETMKFFLYPRRAFGARSDEIRMTELSRYIPEQFDHLCGRIGGTG